MISFILKWTSEILQQCYLNCWRCPHHIRVPRLAHWLISGSLELLCMTIIGRVVAEMFYNPNLAALVLTRWNLRSKMPGLLHNPSNPPSQLRTWSLIKPSKLQERKFTWIPITSPNPIHQSKGLIYPSLNLFNCLGGYPRQFRMKFNFQISKLNCNYRDLMNKLLN